MQTELRVDTRRYHIKYDNGYRGICPWVLRTKIAEGLRPEIDPAVFDCYTSDDMELFMFKGPHAISKYTTLEDIVKEGWSADPQERPSFEELEPALYALFMAIDSQQDEEESDRAPYRVTDAAVRRIPEEDSGHRRALRTRTQTT